MSAFTVDLTGKVALVTGAGRGIGKVIAGTLARSGAAVAINDIDAERAGAVAGSLDGARAYVADVGDPQAVQDMIAAIVRDMGRLDIIVNNAGIEYKAPFFEMTVAQWQHTLDVNLSAAFYTAQSAGPIMRDAGGGVIVNIASIAGHNIPIANRAPYVASKAGLIGLTRECAREFAAYNIRVNAVCPGVIETEMTAELRSNTAQMAKWLEDIPQKRLGTPDDVAGLVLFLCSDGAAYLTGQAINVDGGKVML
ncbi:MAG TPA: glucose 1-dehydrogenase [Aggregatilinea sp.]|uniref:SDR family NAD(P)-dependent oxidoreductase n=1 Tax=Aggregatilinea sp. TaxID=2806333 RepID=UPI002BB13E9A|nr:glucose 1-dehydrogenase [Aggregatilinea sp.]HML21578.1 glucose 1-dehydrogenase [Aggregatilinea sp.]